MDVAAATGNDEGIGNKATTTATDGGTRMEDAKNGTKIQTYPEDCYSFMVLHGPFHHPYFLFFGFMVWAFQMVFLIELSLHVLVPKLSTINLEVDNPDANQTL